jgi:hypothetical protein
VRAPSATVIPTPVLPEFDGPCLTNVVPTLLAAADGATDPLPDWVPAPVSRARQVVLLVLDGLGWEQLQARTAAAPTLAAASGGPITSVAPSTTACALTSLTTGLPPAVHGVVGYRVAADGQVLNVLSWRTRGGDARLRIPPRTFQPHPPFPRACGVRTPVVSRSDYATTGFSAVHLAGTELHPWHTASGLVVEVRRLVERGERFVYAYYDGVDRVSHARGLGEHYEAELRVADRLVADLRESLPATTVLVVTADHGQVEVGPSIEVLGRDVMDGVVLLTGEGRFRWLHARPGATDDVAAAAREAFGHLAWVRTLEELVDDGWLGGEPVPAVVERMGDVALVPFAPTAFLDPADTGEQRLVGRHGSLTSAEMLVPLLAFEPQS